MKASVARTATLGGAIAAAVAASACCVGPLILAVLGIGGAGALVAMEPYRPFFTLITFALLGGGWFLTYRTPAPEPLNHSALAAGDLEADDCGCEMPKTHRLGKRMLWVATGVASLALLFPYLTPFMF